MVQGTLLLSYAAASIVALVLLIARLKLNPFVALVVVSVVLGVAVGMPMGDVVKSFEAGAGGALGHIAVVIALGTMLGKMMAESGGAERIAQTVIGAFGERNVHWAMGCIAFLVGIPVFFDVGFVLLVPIAFDVARRTGASMVLVGIPMVAGLSVVHGLVPPHPAALIAVTAYHADIGRTMLYALLVGLPTAALAGPLFARLVAPRVIPAVSTLQAELTEEAPATRRALPGFGVTVATILLPVALMLVGNWADAIVPPRSVPNGLLRLAGTPVVALLLALLASFATLGHAFDRDTILRFTNECLGSIAGVTLVIGAGAGFGRILLDGGVSAAVVGLATRASVPPLLLGWLVAALIRVATGSATVAMTTACGIVAPLAAHAPGASPELMVLATGAGSLVLSHVNDGGFWLVKEYFGLTVPQTLATWTVCETVISVVALGLTMLLARVV